MGIISRIAATVPPWNLIVRFALQQVSSTRGRAQGIQHQGSSTAPAAVTVIVTVTATCRNPGPMSSKIVAVVVAAPNDQKLNVLSILVAAACVRSFQAAADFGVAPASQLTP